MYVELNLIKQQLNIDASFSGDDTYLEYLEKVAEDAVEQHLAQPLSAFCSINEQEVVDTSTLPASIGHAILLYIATLYANREQVTYGTANPIPFTYDYLLQHYINYGNK